MHALPVPTAALQLPQRLELRLENRRASCEQARLAIERFLAPLELNAATVFGIELVLEEVLMNIIWHAKAEAGAAEIGLGVEVHDDAIALCFEDSGVAFDPTLAAEPVAPATLAEARPGGLGIALVRKFARSRAYERAGDRNRLRVTIAR